MALSKIQQLVRNVITCAPNEEAAEGMLVMLQGYVNPATGETCDAEAIAKIAEEQREATRKGREAMAAKAERTRRNVALEALKGEVSSLTLDEPVTVLEVAAKVTAAGGSLTIDGEGTFGVTGLRSRKGGNNGGGRIGQNDPSGYLDSEGDRILGPLTTWAKDNFTNEELKEMGAFAPQSGKFRTGVKLAKALSEHVSVDPQGRNA